MSETTTTVVIEGIDKLSSAIDEQVRLAKTFYEQTAALHKAISTMPDSPQKATLVTIRNNLMHATEALTANTATTSSTAAEVITTGTTGRR